MTLLLFFSFLFLVFLILNQRARLTAHICQFLAIVFPIIANTISCSHLTDHGSAIGLFIFTLG
jgi:hypothetical protein